ncbi:unnamed protein product [Didymodactylos carnosus]|uniref:Protein regulator of cytokinesis 1 n=1 Tax=Didymodactylos carnosus TaxID=1234261 RepID=A0A8S2GKQ5_9BILA|nr:unnamed protein product [Didymodactylos carnosus]CAF3513067.1 unnamed protein product [Didymodactylos carnosus]
MFVFLEFSPKLKKVRNEGTTYIWIMSEDNLISPGDIVNTVYAQRIKILREKCDKTGDDPQGWIEATKKDLRKMVAEMMDEDRKLYERKMNDVNIIKLKYNQLWKELHPDKECPTYDESFPLLLALRTYEEEYNRLKEQHTKLLEREPEIRREEQELCNELNEKPLDLNKNTLLITCMSFITTHILELREKKAKHIEKLNNIVSTLKEFEELYGWKRPTIETMVGRLLNIDDVSKFSLTKEAIELIEKEFSEISSQVRNAEQKFEQSQNVLKDLIRKHRSLKPTSEAIVKYQQCRLSILTDLTAEVDRYKEHAMDKLTLEIMKARERIHFILDKLSVGQVDSDPKYSILNEDEFTEDLHYMHEELLQELEAQYETNKAMYEQIESWNILFREYQDFEKTSTNPDRFYIRGYSAITESKTRKRLEHQLKECELKLQSFNEDYQRKNNDQEFKINGLSVMSYVAQAKEDYQKSKVRDHRNPKNNSTSSSSTALSSGPSTQISRTPLKTKQPYVVSTPNHRTGFCSTVKRFETNSKSNSRTPLTSSISSRKIVASTPGYSAIKTRSQKNNNSGITSTAKTAKMKRCIDFDGASSATPLKQRHLVHKVVDTLKETDENNKRNESLSFNFDNRSVHNSKSTVAVRKMATRQNQKKNQPTPSRAKK